MKVLLPKPKSLKLLFWLGPMLLVAGTVAGVVSASWSGVPLGLMVAGLLTIATWIWLENRSTDGFFSRRSTQVGTNALVSTIAVLTILGLLNFLAVRYSSRIDLTENQIFTLSPQTQEVVRSLEQPTKVYVFDVVTHPADQALLENYRRQSDRLSYQYIDPRVEPGIAQAFNVSNVGEVYLEQGTQRRLVQTVDAQQRLSERRLTNALYQQTNAEVQKVYFLQGHDERSLQPGEGGFSQAIARMGEETVQTAPLNLARELKVPDDAAAVVVAGPKRPLLPSEVNALQDYLKRSRGLFLMIDPQTNPGLESLLNGWGVTLGEQVVIDPAGQATQYGPLVAVIDQYGPHPITQEFGNGISLFPGARPLALAPVEDVTQTPLLLTSANTRAERITADGQLQFDPNRDPQGPLILGAALSRPVGEPTQPNAPAASPEDAANGQEARLVVVGNSSFASDGMFSIQLNGDFFLNALTWLRQTDSAIFAIRPRELTDRRILLSPIQQISLALLSLVVFPAIAFLTAAIVWWKRR